MDKVDVEAVLENLLSDDYPVSFEAEELVIVFSDRQTAVSRFKVGKLKPFKMRKERYSLDGSIEEVIVHDNKLEIISYPERKVVIRSPRTDVMTEGKAKEELVSLIRANYDIKPRGDAVIAGRSAKIFSISPLEKGTRPSFRVWLDHATGMPLKTETYGLDGSLSFLSALSNIVINPSFPQDYFVIMVPPGTTAFEADPDVATTRPASKEMRDFSPGRLAGGYVLKETMPGSGGHPQLLYHDGLNTISVFSEDWDSEKNRLLETLSGGPGSMIERVSKNGFEGVFCNRGLENVMSFISGRERYVVVGEVTKDGLMNIALDLDEWNKRK